LRVAQILRRVLGPCREIHAARRRCLLAVIQVLLVTGRAAITGIGRALPGRARPKHKIKRVDRLVGNQQLWWESSALYERMTRYLVGPVKRPMILVDWTGIGSGLYALVAALPIAGRGVPILVDVHPKARYGNRKIQHWFLDRLALSLPEDCKPIIVADAGFKAPFYEYIHEMGWGFVIRVRGKNRRFRGRSLSFRRILGKASEQAQDLRDGWMRTVSFEPRLVLGARRPKKRAAALPNAYRRSWHEPWLLATNLWRHTADDIVNIYSHRMKIEEAFRDAKSHQFGWGIEYLQSKDPTRVATMLLVVALATLACALAGIAAEHAGLHRQYQANTVRVRRVLSVVTLGRAVLRDRIGPPSSLWRSIRRIRSLLRTVPQAANSSAWELHVAEVRKLNRFIHENYIARR